MEARVDDIRIRGARAFSGVDPVERPNDVFRGRRRESHVAGDPIAWLGRTAVAVEPYQRNALEMGFHARRATAHIDQGLGAYEGVRHGTLIADGHVGDAGKRPVPD